LPSIVTRANTPAPLSLGPASLTAAVRGGVIGNGLVTMGENGLALPLA
jgi:hypothetical protein